MSKNFTSAAIVAVLLILWLGSGAVLDDTQPSSAAAEPNAQTQTATVSAPSQVRVSVTEAEPRLRFVQLRGRTESKRTVEVKAEIAGQVISRPVERGMRVTPGQLLCEIATDDREVSVEEARAGFEQARIEHAGSLKLANEGLLSDVAIASSEARQEAARAHLHRQVLNMERTRITAPFAGVVEHLPLNAGDYAIPGAPCATLIDLNPMLVVAHVTEEEVESLQIGRSVSGTTRMGQELSGNLSFIGKQSDPVTRTYPVEVTVDNGDYSIRSGLTVNIKVGLNTVQAHRVSPSLLTLNDAGDMGLRILDKANRVIFNPVAIVEDGPDGLWITGLPDSANLITVGHEYVTVGERVDPVYIDQSSAQLAQQ